MMHLLIDLWHTWFLPANQPWYDGGVWANVAAMVPCGLLAGLWAHAKMVKPVRQLHVKHDALLASHQELHRKHDALLEKLDAR